MSRRSRTPAVLGDLPLPEPEAAPGQALAWRLDAKPTRWTLPMIVLAVVLGLLFAIPLVMLGTLLLAGSLVGLLIPPARRRIIARLHASRSPLEIELDRHPLVPGEAFEGVVLFKRPRPLDRLVVALVCDETAWYTQGTDRRSETERVVDEVLLVQGSRDESDDGGPSFADAMDEEDAGAAAAVAATDHVAFRGALPAGAMHSFKDSNNRIEWAIEVRRTFPGTAEVKDETAFQVYTVAVAERLLAEMAS